MKVNAFLAVRLGSSRVPFKNFMLLGKKPMYEYLTDTACRVSNIDQLYFNTDSQIAIDIAESKYGAMLQYYLRPADLGTSSAPLDDYVYDFMTKHPSDITVFLNPCSIFLSESTISGAIEHFKKNSLDSCVASAVCQTHCFHMNEPINFNLKDRQPRSQDLSPIHAMTSGFFIWRNSSFIEHYERNGYANFCGAFESFGISQIESIDIDEPEDFKLAKLVAQDINVDVNKYHPTIAKLIADNAIQVN